jgi:hypothetical protein
LKKRVKRKAHQQLDQACMDGQWNIQWIEKPAIAFAISWAGMMVATLLLFQMGVSIGRCHAGIWVLGYFSVLGLLTWDRNGDQHWIRSLLRVLQRGYVFVLFLVGGLVFSTLSYDFSTDGLSTHQEPVVAMIHGWNPVKDPYFSDADVMIREQGVLAEWVHGSPQIGCAVSFASITSAIMGSVTGNHETGKAINVMVLPMVFGFAFGASLRMGLSRVSSLLWALAVAGNPVILYQSFSFLQDGLVSAVLGCFMLYALSFLSGSVGRSSVWVCSALAFVLAGLKLSGLGYAGIGLFLLGSGALLFRRLSFRRAMLWGLSSIVLVLWAGETSRFWDFSSRVVNLFSNRVAHFESNQIVEGGGGFGRVQGMSEYNKITQFFLSHGSYSHPSPTAIDLKPPFKIDWEEVMVFYRLVGEPRAGGFGPLGSGIILLSVLSGLCLMGGRISVPKALLVVVSMAMVPLFFVPVFWARWIGHLWVLFFLIALPFLGGRNLDFRGVKERLPLIRLSSLHVIGRSCASVLIVAGILNALVVGIPYAAGHYTAGKILRAQMEVVRAMEQPVTAYIGWSRAVRFWMLRDEIQFNRNYLIGVPYTRLFLAQSRVFLSNEVLDAPFDSTRTIRERLLEIQKMSKRLQPGQRFGEILHFPHESDQ